MNTKNKKKFNCTNLRLTDDYEYYSENEEKQQTSKNFNELNELITRRETDISNELVKKYFFVQDLRCLLKNLEKLKNNPEKNIELVIAIKSGLEDLEDEIKNMNEKEKETEKANEIVDIVEKILEFNELNKKGQGLRNFNTRPDAQ